MSRKKAAKATKGHLHSKSGTQRPQTGLFFFNGSGPGGGRRRMVQKKENGVSAIESPHSGTAGGGGNLASY